MGYTVSILHLLRKKIAWILLITTPHRMGLNKEAVGRCKASIMLTVPSDTPIPNRYTPKSTDATPLAPNVAAPVHHFDI